jgi:hypothetical protein
VKNLPVIQPISEIKDHARSRRGVGHKSEGSQPDAPYNASQKNARLDRDIHQGQCTLDGKIPGGFGRKLIEKADACKLLAVSSLICIKMP